MTKKQITGFDGRMFLYEYEWQTYLRRMPVRYIRREHSEICEVCGQVASENNPLQHRHKIGFLLGVREFGLTPDYLDSAASIVSAHKRVCNSKAEWSKIQVYDYLLNMGIKIPDYITELK